MQTLVAGRPWRLQLRGREFDGERPRVGVRGLPPEARFATLGDGGWHVLDWTPPAEAVGALEITLVAIDRREPRLTSERRLRIEVRPAVPGAGSERAARGRDEGSVAFEPSPAPPSVPTIEPLPVQIVSAGHVVRMRIGARLDDGRPPRLTIDPLPARASLDENPDGSHTLYWPTGGGDEGEHRFRITALHPEDDARASSTEALVIVGAPGDGASRSGTSPASTPAASEFLPPAGTADTSGVPEATDDDPRDLAGGDAHDPYSTYDDHPPYDPYVDFDVTYDPQDPRAGPSDNYFSDTPAFPTLD